MNDDRLKRSYLILTILIFWTPIIYSQNVGIGTTNPQEKLHVYDGSIRVDYVAPYLYLNDTTPGNYAGIQFQRQGNTLGNIHFRTFSDYLRINADAGSGLRNDLVIKSNGNIGIGTAAPEERLHLYGGNLKIENEAPFIYLNDTSMGNNTGIVFQKEGVSLGYLYYRTFSDYLCMSTDGIRKDFVIKSNGNVGIGTASPSFKFHVYGSDVLFQDASPFLYLDDTTTTGNSGIQFLSDGYSKGYLYYSNSQDLLRINAETGAGARNDLVITNSGDLGIGTAAPDELLHVYGGDVLIEDYYPFLKLNDTAVNGGNAGFAFKHDGLDKAFFYYNNAADYFKLSNDPDGVSNDFVVNSNGYIGVGTSSPASRLHVSVGNIRVDHDAPFLILDGNTSNQFNAGISFRNLGSLKAGIIYSMADNLIRMSTEASVSRPDLVIDPDGNVGVGTGDPLGDLHVFGDTVAELYLTPNTAASQLHSQIIMSEDADNTYGMRIRFDGVANQLRIFGKNNTTISGPHLSINRDNGNVGVGLTSMTYKLEINGGVRAFGSYIANSTVPYFYADNTGTTGTSGFGIREQGASVAWIYFDHGNNFLTINADNSNGTRRDLVITSTGNVGVGTYSPNTIFTVNHGTGLTDGLTIKNSYDSDRWRWTVGQSTNTFYLLFNDVEKGTYNPTTGAYTATSDLRRKDMVQEMEPVLSKVMDLEVKRYFFRDDQTRQYKSFGLIAQDVEQIFPSAVYYAAEADLYTLDYSSFGVLAIKAIQEQEEVIINQQEEIDQMKEKIDQLIQEMQELRSSLTKE